MEGNTILFVMALIASLLSAGVSLFALRFVYLMRKNANTKLDFPTVTEKEIETEPEGEAKEFSLYLNKDGKYSYRVYADNKKTRDKKTPEEELHDVFDE